MEKSKKVGVDLGLSDGEKKDLLLLARTTIESKLKGITPAASIPLTDNLKQCRGAFVSLHCKGRLRGCIGYIRAEKPLHQTIREMALSAAFNDPRFEPLNRNELKDIDVEISVLTPLQPVNDIADIVVGKHGLMIVKDYRSGLLLPQVATEYGWSREEFLDHTCLKAGLPQTAWKDKDTKIYLFSADVFQ